MLKETDIQKFSPHFDVLQSTRTTFSLAGITESRLEHLADAEDVSEKDILHHYTRVFSERMAADDDFKQLICNEVASFADEVTNRATRVITKGTLDLVNQLATKLSVKRDRVIDIVVWIAVQVHNHQTESRPKTAQEIIREYEEAAAEFDALRSRLCSKAEAVGINGLFGEDILSIDFDNSINFLREIANNPSTEIK